MRLWKSIAQAFNPADRPVLNSGAVPDDQPDAALGARAEVLGLSPDVRAQILGSPFFDAADYTVRSGLSAGCTDPLAHYIAIGEPAWIAPSARFDPEYYTRQYPDIGISGISPLVHFVQYGAQEGRHPLPRLNALSLPPVTPDGRPVVLLVIHEATQTGAPILGWNIAQQLRHEAVVVIVLLKPGKLVPLYAEVSEAVVGPIGQAVHEAYEIGVIARALVEQYHPAYAILNSVESRYIAKGLHEMGVPFVALVHEFASYAKPVGSLAFLYEHAAQIVFPAEMIRQSSLQAYPALAARPTVVLPQGPTIVPQSPAEDRSTVIRTQLRPAAARDAFLVVGIGHVDWRKGVDLFVATAASLFRRWPDAAMRFAWVGDGFGGAEPTDCATYLSEQLDRSHLGDRVSVIGGVDRVDLVYAEANALLLSSRLDPLPNVAIDAALGGIPIICFAEASGIADFLLADEATGHWVVPYLDTGEAARALHVLYDDRDSVAKIAIQLRDRAAMTFNTPAYVAQLHAIGLRAAAAQVPVA